MPATAFFSLDTNAADPRTLSVLLEYVHKPSNTVLDAQKHTITMHPAESRATIEATSCSGVTASQDVYLSADSTLCVDFLPRVFDNTVWPMYAISPDRVAVMMQPFAADIEGPERPLVKFEYGMFEDVFGGRIKIGAETPDVAADGRSGLTVFYDGLAKLFGEGMGVKWGTQQILRP
ncbi:hypothetical protein B0I37DRAFT_448732 [Chaetomium sp. MPI-CAGE-AT-0009]|nr:hypothetical protein B0I37DRAFT_448732 [Chaetomium sp. MPI-CAGE-AT-0009]